MRARVLELDKSKGYALIQLESGEKVTIGGVLNDDERFFVCSARVKNVIGLHTKRIWDFVLSPVPRQCTIEAVELDFSEYDPYSALLGYALRYPSVSVMREAEGKHRFLFEVEKCFDRLAELGVL